MLVPDVYVLLGVALNVLAILCTHKTYMQADSAHLNQALPFTTASLFSICSTFFAIVSICKNFTEQLCAIPCIYLLSGKTIWAICMALK